MLPLRLDSYQCKAKTGIETHNEVIIMGPKNSGKSFLLRNICVSQVFRGKKVLFVMSDAKMIDITIRQMQQYLLKNECVYLKPGKNLEEDVINKVRSFLKRDMDKINVKELNDAQHNYYARDKRIRTYYYKLNQDSLFGKKWHELVSLQAFDRNSFQTLHFNQLINRNKFDFDQEEYDLMILNLNKAFEFNNKGLCYTETVFTGKNYVNEKAESAWKPIHEWIIEVKKKTRLVIQSLSLYLLEKANEKLNGIMQLARTSKIESDQLIASFELYQKFIGEGNMDLDQILITNTGPFRQEQMEILKEEMMSSYHKFVRNLTQDRELKFFLKHENLNILDFDPARILEQLYSIDACFESLKQSGYELVQKELNTISIHNSNDQVLLKIDKELDALYQLLNQQEFLDRKYENTAFSISKQLSQLEKLLDDLNELKGSADRFFKYYEWNTFYRTLSEKEKHLLDKLILLQPKDWVKFFRNWYIQNYIETNKESYLHDVENELEELFNDLDLYNVLLTEKYFVEKSFRINQQLEVIRKTDRVLYKNLIKKTAYFNWAPYAYENGHFDFLQKLFPIHFITVEELYQIPVREDMKWDLMLMDLSEWSDDLSVDPSFWRSLANKKIVVAGDIKQTEKRMTDQLGGTPVSFELKGHHQQNIISFEDMVPTERLYAARTIAHMLQDTNPNISIFHVENYILFSCLSPTLNIVLEKMLDSRGVKKLRFLETAFHSLVENVLEVNARKVLITQDNLLDITAFDRIPWQLHVKSKVRKAGIQIADVNTNRLLENPVLEMLRFIETNFPVKK